jgi:uncharacterized membrane protein
VPVGLTLPLTGIGLIWSARIDPFTRDARWLALGILLYVVLLTFALAVQVPTTERIIGMTAGPPPEAPPGSAPSGPPPALMAEIRKVQRGGLFLTATVAVIVLLMVVKPNLGF